MPPVSLATSVVPLTRPMRRRARPLEQHAPVRRTSYPERGASAPQHPVRLFGPDCANLCTGAHGTAGFIRRRMSPPSTGEVGWGKHPAHRAACVETRNFGSLSCTSAGGLPTRHGHRRGDRPVAPYAPMMRVGWRTYHRTGMGAAAGTDFDTL